MEVLSEEGMFTLEIINFMIQSYYMVSFSNANYINIEIKHQTNASSLIKKLNSLLKENNVIIRLKNSFKQE